MGGVIIGSEVVQIRDDRTGDLVTGSLHVDDEGAVHFKPVPEPHEGQDALPAPEGAYEPGGEHG